MAGRSEVKWYRRISLRDAQHPVMNGVTTRAVVRRIALSASKILAPNLPPIIDVAQKQVSIIKSP